MKKLAVAALTLAMLAWPARATDPDPAAFHVLLLAEVQDTGRFVAAWNEWADGHNPYAISVADAKKWEATKAAFARLSGTMKQLGYK